MGRLPRARGAPRSAAAVLAASAALLLSGCGLMKGGRALTPDAPSTMTVVSQAFGQGVLPQRYTCHGARVSPPISWSGAPAGTQSYAIVVDDSNTPITPYIYWIVFNIPAATTGLQEGQLPPGARQAGNSAGHATYDPPCPERRNHSYRFTVYALRSTLNLPAGTSTRAAWTAIADAAIGRGRIALAAKP